MSKIYFISDTHFCDKNIIKICNRPYRYSDEMNESIISNWNKVITKEDIVYHLGDFCINKDYIKYIKSRLNGNIHLILGNHDYDEDTYKDIGINVIKDKFIYKNYIFSHKPLNDNEIPKGYINIHGHIHNEELNSKYNKNIHRCISVELTNYKPITIEDIDNKVLKK